MNLNDRMEANAIIERMTDGSPHFAEADAHRLMELIPVSRGSRFQLRISRMKSSSSQEGYAAGIGNVSVKDDKRERADTVIGGEPVWRCGVYQASHSPGHLSIRKMMPGALGDHEAELRYGWRNGGKLTLHCNEPLALKLGIFLLLFTCWPVWKTPR